MAATFDKFRRKPWRSAGGFLIRPRLIWLLPLTDLVENLGSLQVQYRFLINPRLIWLLPSLPLTDLGENRRSLYVQYRFLIRPRLIWLLPSTDLVENCTV